MKHNDKTSQSDNSARLDALLSDFLSKDIVAPTEPRPSSHPTSTPLGDLFPDVGVVTEPKSPRALTQTPAATNKVVPVNRTEVWEATSRTGRLPESASSGLNNLAAGQLEKNINSLLEAPRSASGKKRVFGLIAIILLVVAGVLIWQSRRAAVPQHSEEPVVAVSPSEIDAPPSTQAPSDATSVPEPHPGTSHADTANPSNSSSHDQRPTVAVLVPDSSASTGTSYTMDRASQSTSSNAAKLQTMSTPTLGQSNLTLGTIQDLPSSLQPAPPPAPLPLPPAPTASAMKNVVPDSTRMTTATPAVPLTKVQPVYPELALRMNVAGTVHVAIVVDMAGKVISAKAVDGPPVLRGSAELAVKQWRFRPSTMNGKLVIGNGTVSVRFSPDRR